MAPARESGFGEANFRSRIVAFEPHRHVSVEYPPILLIHGTEDSNVPHEQSLLMAQALRQYGVPQRLISLENGEHGFGGADEREVSAAYRTMCAFVIEALEPKPD